MTPFVFDSALVDPLDIARRDQMEYFIEKISDHRGKLSHRNSLQFFVSWMDMINHMILAIQIIFIHTCARKILLS